MSKTTRQQGDAVIGAKRRRRIGRLPIAQLGPALVLFLALAANQPLAAEEPLGRLFFTAERRQQFDRWRQMNVLEQKELSADSKLTIDGVVTRSSGRRTTWINGAAQHEQQRWNSLTATPQAGQPGKLVVRTSDAQAFGARVGDTVNRQTGEVSDGLNGGRISTRSGSGR